MNPIDPIEKPGKQSCRESGNEAYKATFVEGQYRRQRDKSSRESLHTNEPECDHGPLPRAAQCDAVGNCKPNNAPEHCIDCDLGRGEHRMDVVHRNAL